MTCPICSADTHPDYRPFCSRRCADVDLAKWLGGGYAIASQDPEEAEKALEEIEKLQDTKPPKPH